MHTRARKQDCPVDAAMAVIEGRWKSTIICLLARSGGMRFSELQKSIGNVTARILAKQLKELEGDGMVCRGAPGSKSAGVYLITEKGASICPILVELAKWGAEHQMVNVIVPEGLGRPDDGAEGAAAPDAL